MILFYGISLCAKEPLEILLAYEKKDNPPYAYKETNSSKVGITLDILKEVEKRLNVKFLYKRVPWKRALLMVETNHADGLFHASYKLKREEIAIYPKVGNKIDTNQAIMRNSYSLYRYKNSQLSWDGVEFGNLNSKGITTSQGFSIVDKLNEKCKKLLLNNNLEGALDKLIYGKIQGVVNLENRVDYLLAKYPQKYKDIEKVDTPIESKPYYLIFSKNFFKTNRVMTKKIWREIEKIKKSREYDKIKAKYFED